jgi:tight adherence protein C
LVYLGAALVAAGLFVFVWSLGRRQVDTDPLSLRLKVYDAVAPTDEHDLQLQTLSFVERIVIPLADRITAALAARTPDNQRRDLQVKLDLAGRPGNLDAESFLAMRIGAGVVLFLVGLVVGALAQSPLIEAIGSAFGAAFGYFFPTLWLNQKVGGRQKEIRLALPDMMDVLTISVEAGLSFDSAVQRVTEKFHNALAEEFKTAAVEISLGRPRLEALDALGRRCGVDDLHNFIQAVIQSEQMGVGMSRILRLQSDEMRRKRRTYAQEKAAQATLKMMLPMVGCIFPTLWIVLLGPAILILMKHGGT